MLLAGMEEVGTGLLDRLDAITGPGGPFEGVVAWDVEVTDGGEYRPDWSWVALRGFVGTPLLGERVEARGRHVALHRAQAQGPLLRNQSCGRPRRGRPERR